MADDTLIPVAFNENGDDDIIKIPGLGSKTNKSIIKVIGVGGGGGNAVNHMFRKGIHDVSFVVCNTDKQALNDSPVPVHIQLGEEGLGAGNRPEKAREAAEESIDAVKSMLNDGTKMAFVTAGMGGGTGTGAAPVIARVSKEMGILTVGIVTIPFKFEGKKKIAQALDGVEGLAANVDALLVINNERLRNVYGELPLFEAFAKADDTLTIAAKSIAEIITIHGLINLDFNDVKTILKDGGVAIMSTGYGEGQGRVRKAIDDALNSPLLNDNDIYKSKKILISITCSNSDGDSNPLKMDEMDEITDFTGEFERDYELKWGVAIDPTLGNKVKVTILATGFGLSAVDEKFDKKTEMENTLKIATEEEKKRQQEERYGRYYDTDKATLLQKRMPNMFFFDVKDLDNDDLILAIDNSVTIHRTQKDLEQFKKLRRPDRIVKEKVNEPADDDDPSKISF